MATTATDTDTVANNNKSKVSLDIRRRFFKSPEEKKIFNELGIQYDNEMQDDWWDKFQKETRNTPENKVKRTIQNMIRIVLPSGEQYIVHDETWHKEDNIGNPKMFYRGQRGLYEIPQVLKKVRIGSEESGFEKEIYVAGVSSLDIAYSIPFNEKNANKLKEFCTHKTNYMIKKGPYESGERKLSVTSFEAWRDGPVDVLCRFGKWPISEYETQIMKDEAQGKYTHMGVPPAGGHAVYR